MASRVQSSGLQSGEDVTSDSFTLAGVAAGSLLVLCVAAWRDTTNLPAPTVSDNNGNTWVRVNGGYQAGSFNSQRVDIYYAQNANAGQAKGFNAILINLIEKGFADDPPPPSSGDWLLVFEAA